MKNKASNHWYKQQIAAFALIPLFLYVLSSFWFLVVQDGSFESAQTFVQNPLNAIALILLLLVGFYHGAGELISIVDDYVHHRFLHNFAILKIKCSAIFLATVGTLAVLKVVLGI